MMGLWHHGLMMPLVYRSHLINMDENPRQQSDEELEFQPPSWDFESEQHQQHSIWHSTAQSRSLVQVAPFGATRTGAAKMQSEFDCSGEQTSEEYQEGEEGDRKPSARSESGEGNGADHEPGNQRSFGSSDSVDADHGRLLQPYLGYVPDATCWQAEADEMPSNPANALMPYYASMADPHIPLLHNFEQMLPRQAENAPHQSFETSFGALPPPDTAVSTTVERGLDNEEAAESSEEGPMNSTRGKTLPKKKRSQSKHTTRRATSRQPTVPTRRSTRVRNNTQQTGQDEEHNEGLENVQPRNAGGDATQKTGTAVEPAQRPTVFQPSEEEIAICQCPRKLGALNSFYERLNDLAAYKAQHGHCNVPQQYPANRRLGVWVNKMRMEKKKYSKGNSSSLDDRRIEYLDSLGFNWGSNKDDAKWEEHFGSLEDYKSRHGDCDVPTKYPANTSFGRWVSTQRSEYKAWRRNESSLINEEKVARLEALGFKWEAMNPEGSSI